MEYNAIWDMVYPYIDLVWLPFSFLIVYRHQRFVVLAFLASCMLMMRLLIELVQNSGYPYGFFGLLDVPLFLRGVGVYSVFYALYLLLAFFSPGSFKVVLMAASITIFFVAAVCSTIVMVL